MYRRIGNRAGLVPVLCLLCIGLIVPPTAAMAEDVPLRELLDGPLLFLKRHSYQGIHIYDTYYKWFPGGGIYVIENPSAPPSEHRVRPVIDPATPETLGEGVYSDPELSWDAKRLLFCFKGTQDGPTGIYEIGLDGTGLRSLTAPDECMTSCGRFAKHHDVSPAYLPDGRILFTSTRPNGLVPCNNTGVDIMHIMNSDGENVQRISVNNVNEFDPCIMPDGRILHGRWEYVDKTALTQQSLWTIFPDGTNETALFANNLVRPEALLDARPVPGASHLVAATLARHNAPPRGSIALVNTRVSKNSPDAIHNYDHPDDPTNDTGESCEPWPLGGGVVLFSGRPPGAERNALEMVDQHGRREVVHQEADICCHSPIPIKPRVMPLHIPKAIAEEEKTGRFYVQDIYAGLTGIEPGTVKWLRVLEETSRTSATPGGGGPFNQTFLVSAALAFSAKNFLGVVPVEEDGSAHFEVPAGRALYLQALDEEGRMVQSMRTFVQAAPGTTRSCIGCHERKFDAPSNKGLRTAHLGEAVRPMPESWGTGYLDYPSMVQPVLDKHCVVCHGGKNGFAAGLDLSGGWTEFFNISYENLVSRREDQMTASLIAGIDCMNGTALWSAQRFGPLAHGSGIAPLGKVLVGGHDGRIGDLPRRERDLLLAWIDTNGLYYGSWDYTAGGPQLAAWTATKDALLHEMGEAGCMECHEKRKQVQFESDWFNLRKPELSRILRAPLAKGEGGGRALCRQKPAQIDRQRVRLLVGGGYAHAVQPLEEYRKAGVQPEPNTAPAPRAVSFASTDDAHYQAMLNAIRKGRRDALVTPRIDMPGAEIVAGHSRQFVPPPLPASLPELIAKVEDDGVVALSWERSARTIGLVAELYRGADIFFEASPETLLTETRGFQHLDKEAPAGRAFYALVLASGEKRSEAIRASVEIPAAPTPPAPAALDATPGFNRVALQWEEQSALPLRYNVYRAPKGGEDYQRITDIPATQLSFDDVAVAPDTEYAYLVRAVNRRGIESNAAGPALAVSPSFVLEPVFDAPFALHPDADCFGGAKALATIHGAARMHKATLDLRGGGHLTYEHRPEFDLTAGFTLECWVYLNKEDGMPVVVSCGQWNGPGWFLQRLGGGWRWYVNHINCDGGTWARRQWTHLVATFDGQTARLYQDGQQVGEAAGQAPAELWTGPMFVGQYSGGEADPYQTRGSIKGLKLYQRTLTEKELAAPQGVEAAAET